MSKSIQQTIEQIRAEADAKIKALSHQFLEELKGQLKAAEAEVSRIKGEIAFLCGHSEVKATEVKRSKRLPSLVEGSEEWDKVAKQIAIVLKNYKDGLNGKAIATKLGLTEKNEIKRVQPVIQAICRREGAGIATRFFLK